MGRLWGWRLGGIRQHVGLWEGDAHLNLGVGAGIRERQSKEGRERQMLCMDGPFSIWKASPISDRLLGVVCAGTRLR